MSEADDDDKGKERLFSGSYTYYNNGSEYSQEIFTVNRDLEMKTLIYESEILSRVSTGEFLKIKCSYEVSHTWNPVFVQVVKSLGNCTTKETYNVESSEQVISYQFGNEEEVKTIERNVSGKFHISTPAFLTSTLYTMQKRHNSLSRNQYQIIVSQNEWDYESPPTDSFVYLEYKTMDGESLKINGSTLSCSKCLLYQYDSTKNVKEVPATYYISDHLAIPYKVDMGNGITILVDNLKEAKKASDEYKDIFKPA